MRSSSWDSRFPAPGTGEHDTRGNVPFAQMPHSIDPDPDPDPDPDAGYLANWNNKPSSGWLDEFLDPSSSRPAGRGNRVQVIQSLLAAQPGLTPEALRAMELQPGLVDQRAQEFLPLLRRLRSDEPGVDAALDLLRGWDGVAYDRAAYPDDAAYRDETVTDDPDVTVFDRVMDALRDDLFAFLPASVRVSSDAVASHVWELSVIDDLALRVLDVDVVVDALARLHRRTLARAGAAGRCGRRRRRPGGRPRSRPHRLARPSTRAGRSRRCPASSGRP